MFPSDEDPVRGVVVLKEVTALRESGIQVNVAPKRPGWRGYLTQLRAVIAQVQGADLVHAHYGTSGFVSALACGNTPLVVTMHGSDIAFGFRPRLSKYWIQYLLSVLGASRARAIIVQDDTMVNQLPASLRSRARALGQAVRLPQIPAESAERQGVLFLASRHRPVKRFSLAQEAVRLVPDCPGLDSLDTHAVSDIPAAMEASRVGLLTSEREGMPVAVKEALAAGLRVVSVDLPALRALARELPEALTLTAHDPDSIARGVRQALAAPVLSPQQRSHIHDVLRRRLWTEPERTRALVEIYDRAARADLD
ncbi:glycosyltransferase [Gephyromycinifex aptenodytis]|uniref:glycosyltransferase n=1 Tax=Gephyromycinifex aptenodytis TaxID=2716227 RepID=UPI0014475592